MLRVGLTGGIASGKSRAADRFRALGAPVLDADDITRELTAPGEPALAALTTAAGDDILASDGTLDRARLRARICADAALRRAVEAELHPRVRARMRAWFAGLDAPYAVAVVPLLAEAGWRDEFDRVLVLHCPEAVQRARLAQRPELPAGEAEALLAAQLPAAARRRIADDELRTDGSLAELDAAVGRLHARYRAAA